MAIQVTATKFAEAKVFVPDVFRDERGFFKETYSTAKYRALGVSDDFVQDSVSFSSKNVLRGLHYDRRMSKLVQVLRGRIFDAIADLREDSPTYLQWQGFDLSEDDHRQLYVPAGFAHGFLALSDDVVFSYKHGAAYDPAFERSVRFDDPTLAIAWPLAGEPLLSAKDRAARGFSETCEGRGLRRGLRRSLRRRVYSPLGWARSKSTACWSSACAWRSSSTARARWPP